jgi:threonine/homoserine/homoserine lactone efflux protein
MLKKSTDGINMEPDKFYLYLVVASLTIASPGPGVVLSIANSIKHGVKSSIPGILGIALGMFLISIIASSGVGALVIASPTAFIALKYAGALYLIYLAVKLWTSNKIGLKNFSTKDECDEKSKKDRFIEGLTITLLNPKPMIFFIALFPQFISNKNSYTPQFAILSITFCLLIMIIHFSYAMFASRAGKWLSDKKGHRVINRASSLCFFVFALGITLSK